MNLAIILINVFVYLISICALFLLIYIFNTKLFKTLNFLKIFKINNFVYFSFIITLLSISGIPPFLGFFSKLVFVIFVFNKLQIIVLCLFIFYNFFIIFFYLQNLKHVFISRFDNNAKTLRFNYYLEFYLIFTLVVLNFLNMFGIFFLESFFIIILHYFTT